MNKFWGISAAVILVISNFLSYNIGEFAGEVRLREAIIAAQPTPTPKIYTVYSGQELFDAINAHRKEKGLAELKLHEDLCNDLHARYKQLNEELSHKYFESWVAEHVTSRNPYWRVGEIIVTSNSLEQGIKMWEDSPGHRVILESQTYDYLCTYAGEYPKDQKMMGIAMFGSLD